MRNFQHNIQTRATKIDKAQNIHEALEIAKGNWNAYPTEIMTANGVDLPNHKAILRDDNNSPLGIVGSKYELISNNEAFSFFDTLVADKQAKYKSYQEFDGGKKVVVTASFNRQAEVRVGDVVESEIKMVNSFDGSTSFQVMFNLLRLVCSNGMVSRTKENFVSIRHTKNKSARMQNAFTVLNSASNSWDRFLANCTTMNNKRIDQKIVENFINDLLKIDVNEKVSTRKKNIAEQINELVYTGKGNNGSSVWDLYNASTEYADHYMGSSDETRAKSSMFGQGFNLKARALDLALAIE